MSRVSCACYLPATMVTLDADESRYLVTAAPQEAAALRRIPGNRYQPPRRWVFPRHAGVLLALDRLFGRGGWSADADLGLEVEEARGRTYSPAQDDASVELDGAQLAVACSIADKELVKLVPGYRWSPVQRRWFVPAFPLALEILRERFGDHLLVSADADLYVSLRRVDEESAANRPKLVRTASELPPAGPEAPADSVASPGREAMTASQDAPLALQVARLTEAVDQLTLVIGALAAGRGASLAPASDERPTGTEAVVDDAPNGEAPAAEDLRELLILAATDPAGALEIANRRLQTTDAGSDADVRAVAGVAAARAGEFDQALTHLRRSLGRDERLSDPTIGAAANDAYLAAVLGLITLECGPERPIATSEAFREMLLAELAKDAGFHDDVIGSPAARDRLEFFVNDPVLRKISPEVSGFCRIAHLLGIARSGTWMAAERVADVLRDTTLPDESFAFATMLFANVLLKEKCIEEWIDHWPNADDDTLEDDVRLLVSRAGQLERIEPGFAANAALSCLVALAQAPAESASVAQRRALVRLVNPNNPGRPYAEFLAAFPLAELGQRNVLTHFPGYIQTLRRQPLPLMASHIQTVFVQDSGDAGSVTRAIGEEVIIPALRAGGVQDPVPEVLDLLDLLAESPKGDNLLNELASVVEDGEFPGADRFNRDQRKLLYRRALDASLSAGHDHDMRMAFDRLVRELEDEGARSELRTLASKHQAGPKPLRIPCLVLLLEALLEDGAPFEETLDHLVAANAGRTPNDPDDPIAELRGVALVHPQIDGPLRALSERRGLPPTTEKHPPDISGKRLVVVGGHQYLKKHAIPVLSGAWGVKVQWLDPNAAKNGPQPLGLASGAADLVVVNTRCIGHAASERVVDEAKAAGTVVRYQNSHGVGFC
jgi:hypothetical protein